MNKEQKIQSIITTYTGFRLSDELMKDVVFEIESVIDEDETR